MSFAYPKRHRGFVLSTGGWQKLQTKLHELEVSTGHQYTQGTIAKRSQLIDPQGLHPTTVKKILQRQMGVDERSLQIVFYALDLELELPDYTASHRQEFATLIPNLNDETIPPETSEETPLEEIPEFPGSPLPLHSRFYIPHPALQSLALREIQHPGGLLRIRAPQRMGKSSFLQRVLHHAEMQGYTVARIEFQQADEAVFSSLERFLRWFCFTLSQRLQLQPQLDQYWDEQAGSKINCTLYLQRYILQHVSAPLVLSLNEVNVLLDHPQLFCEFLPLLRSWHEEACYDPMFQKLRLVLVYSTESYVPLHLHQSPFNVGLPLELPEFSPLQVRQLIQQYQLHRLIDERSPGISSLMELVGGHPYLIQLALYHLQQGNLGLEQLLSEATTSLSIYRNHLRGCLENLEAYPILQAAFQQVLEEGEILLPPAIAYRLESIGLVRLTSTGATVRCNLYRLYYKACVALFEIPARGRSSRYDLIPT